MSAIAEPRPVVIPVDATEIAADLVVPPESRSIVLFAHGSGSSRHSPRNRLVARVLQEAGLATLLIDLLTPAEAELDAVTRELRFDVGLLARRLGAATEWLGSRPETAGLGVGYFGASTGAAAALVAAAARPGRIGAVVSRGGRPDLAGEHLASVEAPTLLIVGGADEHVLALNRRSLERLACEKRLEVVPGATHLFEEPGALEQVADLARAWLLQHLG
jgi:putative phosphoribosyl transferase